MTENYAIINDVERIVGKAVEDIGGVIRDLAQIMDDKFTAVDERFDAMHLEMSDRFDETNNRINIIDNRIDTLDNRMNFMHQDITSQLFTMQQSINNLTTRIERLEGEIRAIGNDLGELYGSSAKAAKHATELKKMQKELENLRAWAEKVSAQTGVKLPAKH